VRRSVYLWAIISIYIVAVYLVADFLWRQEFAESFRYASANYFRPGIALPHLFIILASFVVGIVLAKNRIKGWQHIAFIILGWVFSLFGIVVLVSWLFS